MGTVTILESRACEAAAKAAGWSEEQLLDLAGEALGRALGRFFPQAGTMVGYLGKGHNAADTLIALRILRDRYGWQIAIRPAFPLAEWAPLTRKKWDELEMPWPAGEPNPWRESDGPLVLLDGLLGIGSHGDLREPLIRMAAEMEGLRQGAGARVAAVDLPTGVDPDTGKIGPHAVTADITFMIANAKRGLLLGHSAAACGALALVPVKPLAVTGSSALELIAPQTLSCGKSPRPFDFHKGLAGRVALVAGSENYTGAAVISATGALRGGAGLVTLFVPKSAFQTVAAKCPAEIIVRPFTDPLEVLETRFDALAVGCGLGKQSAATAARMLELIAKSPVPTVVDADALNLIAAAKRMEVLSERHMLTPHPGEFARLAPDLKDLPREEAVRQFIARTPATLLLKGCRTIVGKRGYPLRCNSTGTPGMASGGQGDLLAGVIAARLAIGDDPRDAASLGAWICGRAAESAQNEPNLSEESLVAGDVALFLGAAFRDWHVSHR